VTAATMGREAAGAIVDWLVGIGRAGSKWSSSFTSNSPLLATDLGFYISSMESELLLVDEERLTARGTMGGDNKVALTFATQVTNVEGNENDEDNN
jgi:hypothetical protein